MHSSAIKTGGVFRYRLWAITFDRKIPESRPFYSFSFGGGFRLLRSLEDSPARRPGQSIRVSAFRKCELALSTLSGPSRHVCSRPDRQRKFRPPMLGGSSDLQNFKKASVEIFYTIDRRPPFPLGQPIDSVYTFQPGMKIALITSAFVSRRLKVRFTSRRRRTCPAADQK